MEVSEASLREMFGAVMPLLDERQRRVLAGAQARALGRGGIATVARSAGMSRTTVQKAVAEVGAGVDPVLSVRQSGGGRKRLIDRDPALLLNLDDLVEPEARGDPMCPLRWTSKSTGHIADALVALGHKVSPDTVGRLLVSMDYSLQATAKQLEGSQHPDRDAQFVYLTKQVGDHLRAGQPVISVDSKKKPRSWANWPTKAGNISRKADPSGSTSTTSPIPRSAKPSPSAYTTSPPTRVSWLWVTTTTPPPSRWPPSGGGGTWSANMPTPTPNGYSSPPTRADQTGIGCDCGKSSSAALRPAVVWRSPCATSRRARRNGIAHRLWSAVSMNWRGRPLTSHKVVVNLIGATTNKQGLKVQALLDTGSYPKGLKITDAEIAAIPLTRHAFHSDWNYTVHPEAPAEG